MSLNIEELKRKEILKGLYKLDDNHRSIFMRMYYYLDEKNDVKKPVAILEGSLLDRALIQVTNTLKNVSMKDRILNKIKYHCNYEND